MAERKRVLSLGTVSMDIMIEALEFPKEDGFAFIESERLVPSGSAALGDSVRDLQPEEIEEIISLSTIFSSGQEGYFKMTGEKDYHRAIKIFLKRFPSIEGAICTAGDEGALWLDKKELIHVDAYQ